MIIHEMEQGTPEWFEIKKGKLSASHGQAIATAGAGLKTLVKKIVVGMIVPHEEGYKGKDMERGNELEPTARQKYEFEKGVDVIEVGFIEMSNRCGCSPDGLVGDEGMIEIKARNNEIHYELLNGGAVDSKTIWQMNMQMFVANRKWCDFVSYNPNYKKNSLFVKRFYRDEDKINKLRKGIYEGTKMINEALKKEWVQNELASE